MKINVLLLILVLPVVLFSQKEKDTCVIRIEKITSLKNRIIAFNTASENAWQTGEYERGVKYADIGLNLCKEIDIPKWHARLLTNRGVANDFLGRNTEALNAFFEALKIQEKINEPSYEAYIYGNIGLVYHKQRFFEKALEYHQKSLKIRRAINTQAGISASLCNIGNVYHEWKQYDKAIVNYKECVEIDSKRKDSIGLGDDYNNMGNCYLGKQEYDTAFEYYSKSLKIRENMNDPYVLAQTTLNLGLIHFNKNEFSDAKPYFVRSLEISDRISAKDLQINNLDLLYNSEERLGDTIAAYTYFKMLKVAQESSDNAQDIVSQTELELNYEYDKQKQKDKLIQEKKDAQEKLILYGISAITVIIVFFSMLLFRRWKQTQLQKSIIEEKNILVQQKNDEITDSITYAKRIQTAILPSKELMVKLLPNHSLIYLPKDIVAGDFYWLEEIDGIRFVAVADCTGHGVPGALLSVVCHNALNRSVREYNLQKPGEILDKTREIILSELSKNNTVVNDGMDISLCVFKPNSTKLLWAGANNPIVIYRNSLKQLEEIRADKQPIGNHWKYENFTTHEVQMEQGDRIFLFTDGFADQFGGVAGKKLKSTGLKEQLLFVQNIPVEEREMVLSNFFNHWKGKLEQLDDVCLLDFSID